MTVHSDGYKSLRPHKESPVAQMTGIAKPYPINNALAPAIACSSTIAQRGPDCAFGFPGSSTDRSITEQRTAKFTRWLVIENPRHKCTATTS